MTRTLALILSLGLALPAAAQQMDESVTRERVTSAPGAVLRGLDKLSGTHRDLELKVGESASMGRLQVTLGDCRYPSDNPAGDAFAYVVVREAGQDDPVFQGWMIATAPALNAMEHPRYDLWVIRCTR